MNRAAFAKALRELADQVERGEERPKKKRLPVAPDFPIDEVTQARVRRILREKGYRDVY